MGKLANKVAVVTGASKAMGAGLALAIAAERAAAVVNSPAKKLAQEAALFEGFERALF
jgi:3-oxoacyl-[acyl-carrier protein] reductase